MPKNITNPRHSGTERTPCSGMHSKIDREKLTDIKVTIRRPNIKDPISSLPLLRNFEEPHLLKIHFRPDEGLRSIFDRDDVLVKKICTRPEHYSRKSSGLDQKRSSSRSDSSSSSVSSGEDVAKFIAKLDREKSNPQQHSSREYPKERSTHQKEYYNSRHRRSKSNSSREIYSISKMRPSSSSRYDRSPPKESSRLKRERSRESPPRYRDRAKSSRSPSGYRPSQHNRRKSSRSPPHKSEKTRYPSRSPPKYRGPPERRRQTRSPPSSSRSRARSRNRTPSHRSRRSRSRYSRSPRRHDRDYRRSRSPIRNRSRYSPEHHSRRSPRDDRAYPRPRIHPPYFDVPEFWFDPSALQPRLGPRMIPPGPFPYGPPFRPVMPIMIPPRPRIIYNNRATPRLPAPATEASVSRASATAVTSSVAVAPPLEENRTVNTGPEVNSEDLAVNPENPAVNVENQDVKTELSSKSCENDI